MTIAWLNQAAASPDENARQAAKLRQSQLTKPGGALGRLETVAIQLAALQGRAKPQIEAVQITVFVGDHGVAAENVSAFPQAVTAEMVKNFARGGAAICVSARAIGATLEVINLGTVHDTGLLENVNNINLGPGTANFTQQAAMTEQQLTQALAVGQQAGQQTDADLFIGGEMGIANTTVASTLACALLMAPAAQLVGPGTGLDQVGIQHKTQVIQHALERHLPQINSPLEALRRLGGFEIAALTGAYIACAQKRLPVLVDGFISSVAALTATRLCPGSEAWFLFAHASAEPGHQSVLKALNAQPLLDLGMRLGEGSGAAIAVPLLRSACALHNEMATFDEAAISEKLS
ncbi:Nicotinate-nucleotide--dimethylbenzimidazole phosphoribosyltransferase [hydrothermal vent metagenome]|uniref:Nicotinate-nucleotide--dimethylbenzimidazole phosphoribosyltransferase n=1 Tax=hydrothermal vent metagenome TaxID=652676 RepID=A0A3B0Z2K2_9ZZZZ